MCASGTRTRQCASWLWTSPAAKGRARKSCASTRPPSFGGVRQQRRRVSLWRCQGRSRRGRPTKRRKQRWRWPALAAAAARAAATSSRGRAGRCGGRGRGRRQTAAPAQNGPCSAAPRADRPDAPASAAAGGRARGTQSERRVAAAEAGILVGLAQFDAVSLQDVCRTVALTLQSAPQRLRGALCTALRTGLRLATSHAGPDDQLRGWKLFLLAPRMLLYRAAGESHVAPAELDRRNELFRSGHWQQLLHDASAAARGAGSRGPPGHVELKHFCTLVSFLPPARPWSLVADLLAAGTQATLEELRDPQRISRFID